VGTVLCFPLILAFLLLWVSKTVILLLYFIFS
jgi:hypothetical protein